jgi:hypothetical protein
MYGGGGWLLDVCAGWGCGGGGGGVGCVYGGWGGGLGGGGGEVAELELDLLFNLQSLSSRGNL